MKENTGAVHAQVPVDVATFLLNEKRSEIHSIEERLDVDVVLIPNIHLETPHYKIVRVRHDDVAEAGEAPSYKRVEVQEEDVITNFGLEKPKLERQEAAVKGITPQQPAPSVAAKVAEPELACSASWVLGSRACSPSRKRPLNRPRRKSRQRSRSSAATASVTPNAARVARRVVNTSSAVRAPTRPSRVVRSAPNAASVRTASVRSVRNARSSRNAKSARSAASSRATVAAASAKTAAKVVVKAASPAN
ncbi:hypothetical protein JOS77_22090 [Chromobacterium haemolyticum]|nr:hypothetical protein JOS77_22090 [Chromobacterium haemolyticum]